MTGPISPDDIQTPFSQAQKTQVDLLIAGQGFSGISTLCNLIHELKNSDDPYSLSGAKIAWPDPACSPDTSKPAAERLAMGIVFKEDLPDCYRTTTPAWTQSILGDDIEDFTRWLQERNPAANADTFTTRADVAHYIRQRVGETLAEAEKLGIQVDLIPRAIAGIKKNPDGALTIKMADSDQVIEARQLVMGTGHKSRTPDWAKHIASDADYIPTPSAYERMKDAAAATEVTLVGFGNTGLDAVRALEKSGFQGVYKVISPRQKLGFVIDQHDRYHPSSLAQAQDHVALPVETAREIPSLPSFFYDGLKEELARTPGAQTPENLVVAASEYFYQTQITSDALKQTDPENPMAFFPNNLPDEEDFLQELLKRGVEKQYADAIAEYSGFYGYDCMEPGGVNLVRALRDQGRFVYQYGHLQTAKLSNGVATILIKRPDDSTEIVANKGPIVNCSPWQRGVKTNEGVDPLFASLQAQGLIDIDEENLATATENSNVSIVGAAEMQHWGMYEIGELARAKVLNEILPRMRNQQAHAAPILDLDEHTLDSAA